MRCGNFEIFTALLSILLDVIAGSTVQLYFPFARDTKID